MARPFCTDIVVGEGFGTFRLGSFGDDARAGVLFDGKEVSLFPDHRAVHHNRFMSGEGFTEDHERLVVESLGANRTGLRYDRIYRKEGVAIHQYASFRLVLIPCSDGDSYTVTRVLTPNRYEIPEEKVERMRQLLDTGNPMPVPGTNWFYAAVAAVITVVAAAAIYLLTR